MNPAETLWIIRVAEREYGPVDLQTLQEWKSEGRVLATNEVRRSDVSSWTHAADIPGLFDPGLSPAPSSKSISSRPPVKILTETFRIYRAGFFKFLGLTLLVTGPALLGQLFVPLAGAVPNISAEARTLLGSVLAFCMMLLTLVLTPIYIAGIQLLSAELHFGRNITFAALLNDAAKFWPRVAVLWIFVFLCYAFWTVVPVGLIFSLLLGGPSFFSIFIALLLLGIQVWITGRLFINFLFWQQFAVLDCCDVGESLRRSKELARAQRDGVWYERPIWRGVFIASAWFAVVLALNWPAISSSYHVVSTALASASDAQVFVQKISDSAQGSAGPGSGVLIGVVQAILKPLLGIAFVVLYLASRPDLRERV